MGVEQPEGEGFDATRMPTKTEVQYVKFWDYHEADGFIFKEQDDFDNLYRNWYGVGFLTEDDALTSDFSLN